MAPRLALIGSRSRPTTVDTFALEIMPQELNWRNSNLSLRILRTEARKYLHVLTNRRPGEKRISPTHPVIGSSEAW